jgi:glutaredoxin
MHQHESNDWKKYVIVLFITSTIFISGLWLSSYLTSKKINQVRNIEDKISLDLMSSETQFSLLEEVSCKDISNTVLSSELSSLAAKISYSESNMGVENVDVISLKKYYSILEIKDYLLMKKITNRCGQKSVFVLYFYGNDKCDDCVKQGYVLTSLSEKYPNLRVYSFDYNLDLSALRAMISIYKVPNNLPAIVIDGKVYGGFNSLEDIEKLIPGVVKDRENEIKAKALLEEKAAKEKINAKNDISNQQN